MAYLLVRLENEDITICDILTKSYSEYCPLLATICPLD
jgi:hypothetical protein